MRIFFAGASGVIGPHLIPRLLEQGHEVVAMTRTPEKAGALEAAGAEPVVCDVLDPSATRDALVAAAPEVVIHHLTDLPTEMSPKAMSASLEATSRVRTEGTANLVEAAREAGARRIVAQSIAFAYAPVGGPVKTEEDPLYLDAPDPILGTTKAVAELERRVTTAEGLEGLALRFGFWYGPGTAYGSDGHWAREVVKRRLPVVGKGDGISSFVHVGDVATATILALEQGAPGLYNIVDDDPAPGCEWIPAYAKAVGAQPPRRIPALAARVVAGKFAAFMMTQLRGASNEKAKRELGFEPHWSSWREGFEEDLG